jgi:hypothetical protein
MAGCASGSTGSPGISSLGREVRLLVIQGQDPAQTQRDDQECVAWTRATKGPTEPMPSAELRYAMCAISRGYQVDVLILYTPRDGRSHVSSPAARTLEIVLADWQTCRMDKTLIDPFTSIPDYWFIRRTDADSGRSALGCLAQLGYLVGR